LVRRALDGRGGGAILCYRLPIVLCAAYLFRIALAELPLAAWELNGPARMMFLRFWRPKTSEFCAFPLPEICKNPSLSVGTRYP